MLNRRILLALVIVLSFTLTACGSGDTADEGNDAVALSQSVSGQELMTGGTFTVNYPEGWFAEISEDGSVNLASSEEALGTFTDGPSEGQTMAVVSIFPLDMVTNMIPDGEATAAALATVFSGDLEGVEVEEVTLNGKPAAIVASGDEGIEGLIIVVEVDGAFAFLAGAIPTGEIDAARATFEAIAGSITYTAAE